jgi:hypothetical protein
MGLIKDGPQFFFQLGCWRRASSALHSIRRKLESRANLSHANAEAPPMNAREFVALGVSVAYDALKASGLIT